MALEADALRWRYALVGPGFKVSRKPPMLHGKPRAFPPPERADRRSRRGALPVFRWYWRITPPDAGLAAEACRKLEGKDAQRFEFERTR
jgi:hypothetical protein